MVAERGRAFIVKDEDPNEAPAKPGAAKARGITKITARVKRADSGEWEDLGEIAHIETKDN